MVGLIFIILAILCVLLKWKLLGTLLCLFLVLGILIAEIKGIEGGK